MARSHVTASGALRRSVAVACATALVSASAVAQVPLDRMQEFLRASSARRGFVAGSLGAPQRPALLRAIPPGARWVPLGPRQGAWRVGDVDLSEWAASGGTWSAPLHLLLERARSSLELEPAVLRGAGTGQGVVIGIVDAGIDATHLDFRNSDGTTRIAWWIDFVSNPAGRHPELEAALGCQPEAGLRCQILDASDLDERIGNTLRGDEPTDPIGHGTHVASLAAGNGLARADRAFAGIAPEATLIVARVTGASGGIRESDVVLASEFVFQRAAELGMPAVVNLSLGGDFGAHDGSSQLSRALSGLVGAEHPGRAIVVAAGNSGQLLRGLTSPQAEPLGIHTEVQLTPAAPRRLALLTPAPASGREQTDASIFIWLNLFAAADLTLGLELPDGTQLGPIGLGQSQTVSSGELTAAIVHGLDSTGMPAALEQELPELELGELLPSEGAAVILIDGRWVAGGSFYVELAGQGRAELWAQSEGDLAPEASPLGAVFANASAQQTITIPASDPALLAVGASVNRLDWTDFRGNLATFAPSSGDAAPVVGEAAFFSSAGPNRLGDLKPDLLAPGGFVIAALSAAADPRSGGRGVFSGLCLPLGCQVVSSEYAVTAGTSMAAPLVSGAIALLLERAPRLTQPELRGLLQAGSDALPALAEPGSREGGGVLNLARSVAAQSSVPALGGSADAGQSRLRFAGDFLVPDPSRALSARLWLRDGQGDVLDAALERLSVQVRGADLAQPLERVGPGLYGFALSSPAPARSATLRVDVALDGTPLLEGSLPVAGVVQARGDSLGGGCRVALGRAPEPLGLASALLGLLAGLGLRRRSPLRSRPGTP